MIKLMIFIIIITIIVAIIWLISVLIAKDKVNDIQRQIDILDDQMETYKYNSEIVTNSAAILRYEEMIKTCQKDKEKLLKQLSKE